MPDDDNYDAKTCSSLDLKDMKHQDPQLRAELAELEAFKEQFCSPKLFSADTQELLVCCTALTPDRAGSWP